MKLFVMLLSMALSVSAFAKDDAEQTQDLIKALIENSSAITVVDQDLNTKEKNLSALLSEALAASAHSDDNVQIVVSVYSSCKDATTPGIVGVSTKDCRLMVLNADYKTVKNGLQGPGTESSMLFTFKITTPVVPHPQIKIKDNVVHLQRAG